MRLCSLIVIAAVALSLAACGGGGGGGGGSSNNSSGSTASSKGLVQFGDAGPGDHLVWSGKHLKFRPTIQFGASHSGNVNIPFEIRRATKTGTLIASGSATATDAGDGTHTFFDGPIQDYDLSAETGGTDIWVILDPAKTLVQSPYDGPAYDFYREDDSLVPSGG